MIIQRYITCNGVLCEYKNCKKEASYIQVVDTSDKAYQAGKLRCEACKNK